MENKFEGGTTPPEEILGAVEKVTELSFDDVDNANIPVNIWLVEEEDDDGKKTGYYELSAGDYMPRKERVVEGLFKVRSKDIRALRKIVKEKIIPLYQTALVQLEAVASGKSDNLYYWDAKIESEEPSSKE